MYVGQRSERRVGTALHGRRIGDPRRAHYPNTGDVLTGQPQTDDVHVQSGVRIGVALR
jgi:hypothetical protein